MPLGQAFANPFRDEAMMVPLRSGDADTGAWREESVNVKADFKRYFDRDVDRIEGIAVMTDCDNHGGRGQAWFGNIWFSAQ